jgi:MFS family permease
MLTKLLVPGVYARYVSLLAATLLVLPAGSMYGFGAYSTQLAAALGKRNSEVDTLGSAGDLGVYLGIAMGVCWDVCGSQVTTVLSLLLVSGGYLLNYLVLSAHLPFELLYATYFLIGQGSYGMYVNGLSTTLRNFEPRHRGKVVGYMNSLFGLSSVIFTAVYQNLLGQNVETYFLVLAACTLLGNVIGFLFVEEIGRGHPLGTRWCTHWLVERRERQMQAYAQTHTHTYADADDEEEVGVPVQGGRNEAGLWLVGAQDAEEGAEGTVHTVVLSRRDRVHRLEAALGQEATGLTLLRSPDFYLLFFGFFMVTGTGLMWKNIVGSVTDAFGLGDGSVASSLVMTWGLVNALSRLLAGLLSDLLVARVPRPSWMVLANLVMLLAHLSYLLVDSSSVLWVIDVGTGVGYGFAFALYNGLLVLYFGTRYVGLNLGMLNLAPAIGGTLFTFLSTQLVNAATPASSAECSGPLCYRNTFVLSSCGLMVGVWVVLLLTYRHYVRWFRCADERTPLTGAVQSQHFREIVDLREHDQQLEEEEKDTLWRAGHSAANAAQHSDGETTSFSA